MNNRWGSSYGARRRIIAEYPRKKKAIECKDMSWTRHPFTSIIASMRIILTTTYRSSDLLHSTEVEADTGV